jgi:phospholipid transport system substrate-binding protein
MKNGIQRKKRAREMAAWLAAMVLALFSSAALAQQEGGDSAQTVVQSVVGDVMQTAKSDPAIQAGDKTKIRALVETKIMPHADFERTTRLAMGPQWANATPQQRQELQREFATLLINTYSGAIAQIKDQTVSYSASRGSSEEDAVVRSQVSNPGGPMELDYRLVKTPEGWKVYDISVMGAWLIAAYRDQFRDVIQQKGVDGLIAFLKQKNQAAASDAGQQ